MRRGVVEKFFIYIAVVLFFIVVLSEWLWWEIYRNIVVWSRVHSNFPLPLGLGSYKIWFLVDLAMTLIAFSSLTLVMIIIHLAWEKGCRG